MLSLALKNGIMIFVIILIVHFLIKKYILAERVTVATTKPITQEESKLVIETNVTVPMPEKSESSVVVDDDEILSYINNLNDKPIKVDEPPPMFENVNAFDELASTFCEYEKLK